jgi:hypothetical protein
MPNGKPAGVPCIQLDAGLRCMIFGSPLRPPVCAGLQPSEEMCGSSREQSLLWLTELEYATCPKEIA